MKIWKYEILNEEGRRNYLTLAILDMEDEIQNKTGECMRIRIIEMITRIAYEE